MSPLDLLGTEGTLFLYMLQPFVRVVNKGQENLSNIPHGYLPQMRLACVSSKELQIVSIPSRAEYMGNDTESMLLR
jgi:hypothetical protein